MDCELFLLDTGKAVRQEGQRQTRGPGIRWSLILRVSEALWSHSIPATEALSAPAHFKSEETEEPKVKSLPHAHQAGEWWMSLATQNGLNAEPELARQNQEVANPLGTF